MWIKAGTRYFNTDAIAYIQVSMDDHASEPRTLYLHFTNETHTCTLHGPEAAIVFRVMQDCVAQSGAQHPTAVVAGVS